MNGRYEGARSYNWLIHRLISAALGKALEKHGKGVLLDVGCGTKPAKSLMPEAVRWHLGMDLKTFSDIRPEAEAYASMMALPLAEAAVDTVLCNDVLEHVPDPESALGELYKVLKPDGSIIITVPLLWHLHEQPHDFQRFTRYGLENLLCKAGFTDIQVQPLSGFCATFAQLGSYFLHGFSGGVFNPLTWLAWLFGHLLQLGGWLANTVERRDIFTMEYLATARKPSP